MKKMRPMKIGRAYIFQQMTTMKSFLLIVALATTPGFLKASTLQPDSLSMESKEAILDTSYIRKFSLLKKSMEASDKQSSYKWHNSSGAWIGVNGADTIRPTGKGIALSLNSNSEMIQQLKEMGEHPDFIKQLKSAGFTPREYLMKTKAAAQALFLAPVYQNHGEKRMLEVSKNMNIPVNKGNIDFVIVNGAKLRQLGFPDAVSPKKK